MKTLNRIILTALIIFIALPCISQIDSLYKYSVYEFDLTAYKFKKKLIASSNKIVSYNDTLEYTGISKILLLNDTARFSDYGNEIKLNLSEVSELSFKTGSNSWLGVLIGIPAGLIIGGFFGNAIDPPQSSGMSIGISGGAIFGCLLGAITGGLVGGFVAPSSYDNYHLKGVNNNERRNEMMKILEDAKTKYKSDL
jgi:hypothetical protein